MTTMRIGNQPMVSHQANPRNVSFQKTALRQSTLDFHLGFTMLFGKMPLDTTVGYPREMQFEHLSKKKALRLPVHGSQVQKF